MKNGENAKKKQLQKLRTSQPTSKSYQVQLISSGTEIKSQI